MHISLPAGAPTWAVGLSLLCPVLVTLIYGLGRLARAVLPDTSAERLAWWKYYWQYRRDLRRDRWKQREQRWARRHTSSESRDEGSYGVEGLPKLSPRLHQSSSSANSGSRYQP